MANDLANAERVAFAQEFFRFAHRVGGPISFGLQVALPPMPSVWSLGKLAMAETEFEISSESFELCGTILERLAYRLLAMELNVALEAAFGPWKLRCRHDDEFIRNSCIIVWIIRNAVAHRIFDPVWKIDDKSLQDREFFVDGIMTFSTAGMNGRHLERLDFGGPIALFRLSEKLLPLL